MSEIADPEELLKVFESWGPDARILCLDVNGGAGIYRNEFSTRSGQQIAARKLAFHQIESRLKRDGDGWKVIFVPVQDKLDFHILHTLKQIQDNADCGLVDCPGLYQQFVDCDLNQLPEGKRILKLEVHVGSRLAAFLERGLIRLTTGKERDLSLEPFHAALQVTGRGEQALRNGIEKFSEAEHHQTVSNQSNFKIGSINAQQANVGDQGSQSFSQTVNINITVGQLLDAAEAAIDESDASEEVKVEAKSGLQKFRDAIGTSGSLCTIGNTIAAHIPFLLDLAHRHG